MFSSEEKWLINIMERIISINAVNPAFGGPGEAKRVEFLGDLLDELGFSHKIYEYKETS